MTRLRPPAIIVALACFAAVPAHAFLEKIHQEITRDELGFLKPGKLTIINKQHIEEDNTLGRAGRDSRHFNDCEFEGASTHIRKQYTRLLRAVSDKKHDVAAERFGELLHTVQDFYAHSNWVESGQTGLLDSSLSDWPQLTPMQRLPNGVVLLEKQGKKEPGGTIQIAAAMSVALKDGRGTHRGIVTGAVWRWGNCPKAIHDKLGHWKDSPKYLRLLVPKRPMGLNKDDPSAGARHQAAKALARKATHHEWCRLLSLVSKSGPDALSSVLSGWTSDQARARASCPGISTGQR